MIKKILYFIIKHSVHSLSRATKLKKDQLSSSIIKQNRIFLGGKSKWIRIIRKSFFPSSLFSYKSFKMIKIILCFIINHSVFRLLIAGFMENSDCIFPLRSFLGFLSKCAWSNSFINIHFNWDDATHFNIITNWC